MNVTECYGKIGKEFYPEDRMNINYCTHNYNEAFKEIVSFNKDYNGLPHNIKPYKNLRTFKSNYRIYVFDTKYQSDHIGPQTINLISKVIIEYMYSILDMKVIISVHNQYNFILKLLLQLPMFYVMH